MALRQKHRDTLYSRLSPVAGEEETQALLDQFPAREQDEPATKADLAEAVANLATKGELAQLGSDLRAEMASLGSDLRGEMAGLHTELHGGMANLRTELHGEMADLRTELRVEIANLRTELQVQFHKQSIWVASACAGSVLAAATIAATVG